MGQPNQRRRGGGGTGRWVLAAILALVAHGLFALFLLFLSLLHLGPLKAPASKRRPVGGVAVRPVTADEWAKNRGEKQPPSKQLAQREAEKKKEKKPQARPEGQVVDVAPGNEQAPDEADYVAESNNRVQKETRAKEQTAFYRNAMPRRTTTTPQEQATGSDDVEKAQVAGNDGLADDDRPLRDPSNQKSAMEIPDVKRREEIALKTNERGPGAAVQNSKESAEVKGNSDRLRLTPGAPGGQEEASQGKKGRSGAVTLVPSLAVLDKLNGAAANDHLRDVEEGEGTFLNTKEWKFSSFFNRVKQSVGMQWNPASHLRQRDPSGNIYGGRDRYTVLSVTLNDRGMVKDIFVEKSSGLDFLDLEAIESFHRAQPFPNPPPGLIASDSTVQFSFGFFLEMGGGPGMRLFRRAN